jgi:hypothetical protein
MPQPPVLDFLFTMRATLGASQRIGRGPIGTRVIVPVTGGTFEGPKLSGVVMENGGDWVQVREDGSLRLDVRITLHTADAANIYMAYTGIGISVDGQNQLRTAPLFETGDERYAWLNRLQAVATGTSGNGEVNYDVFALTL